jgi:hypothetical protein
MRSMKRVLVVLSLMALVPVGHVDCAEPTVEPSEGSKSVTLEVVATTMSQIVLQWTTGPANRTSFQLQRATDPSFAANVKTYRIVKNTLLFSDTDREPVSKRTFMPDQSGPVLDPKTTYCYRVKVDLADGGAILSNTVRARVSGPVRGKEGDLWADVVLGKPNFGENVCYYPTKYGLCFPGGVLIDRTVSSIVRDIGDFDWARVLIYKKPFKNIRY